MLQECGDQFRLLKPNRVVFGERRYRKHSPPSRVYRSAQGLFLDSLAILLALAYEGEPKSV